MSNFESRAALITGANVGIGKEVARQLALSGNYRKICLACRSQARADRAKQDLEAATGKSIFETTLMDVSNPASVRAATAALGEPIDDLVMNAGDSGGKTPLALTKDGVTEIFAANVLGHVVLLEGLIAVDKLKRIAVSVGSEAARGVPTLGMKRPTLSRSSADEFASLCDGTYFRGRKANATLAYGQVKYVGALWMASAARRFPQLKLVTMSPGNTRGTGRDARPASAFAVAVELHHAAAGPAAVRDGARWRRSKAGATQADAGARARGAKRLVDALDDDRLESGRFYGSKANGGCTEFCALAKGSK